MKSAVNVQWCVARLPTRDENISSRHFAWQESRIPELQDGEFLVRTVCLAPAPAQRGYLEPGYSDFLPALAVGEVMRGRGIGQIIDSRHPDYAAGEIFIGSLGWQTYSVQKPRGAEFVFSTRKIAHPVRPLSLQLGILGQAGATAFFGLIEVGALQAGDTVLVSAAAGGVGSVAGQIARIKGARLVVGTAGSDAKCRWLCDTLGYDVAINYKTENLHERLRELFPTGIDVFFDNVGGEILNAALANLAMRARVVICGFIASNYAVEPQPGPGNYSRIVYKRARMEGFVLFDYWNRYQEAEQALLGWYRAGLLKNCEDVTDGLENMPDALGELFRGGNTGIKICRVAPDPEQLSAGQSTSETAITAKTITHYNERAADFREGTRDHDVRQNIDALLRHIRAASPFRILDFGCGPGRDLAAFRTLGHEAIGLDGSPVFASMARETSDCEVWEQDFLALKLPAGHFDGIFANASLFHVPSQQLPRVLSELHATLRPDGVLFSSNPRGDNEEGWNRGRYGVYHDLESWKTFVEAAGFSELEHYYRPPGLPIERQPWLASVWRKVHT